LPVYPCSRSEVVVAEAVMAEAVEVLAAAVVVELLG
jgi:hypothetical protein